jgi:hypothetical protein
MTPATIAATAAMALLLTAPSAVRAADATLPSVPMVPAPAAEAAGPPRFTVSAEVRVSRTPTSLATRSREPIVAGHPTRPGTVAAVFPTGAAVTASPTIRISHDGGRTWHDAAGHPAGGGNHPAIAWGPGPGGGSRLYYVAMGGAADVYHPEISFSDDEGAHWSAPRVADRTRGWFGCYPDITVDDDPASPGYGTVWVVYNWLQDPSSGTGMRVLASRDFGRSYEQVEIPRLPAPRGYPDAWRIGYRVTTAPDGSAYVSGSQLDLRHWNVNDPFSDGGPGNVGRLAFAVTRVTWDRAHGVLRHARPSLALRLPETAWDLGYGVGVSPILTDPVWMNGLAVDRSGAVLLAVAADGRIAIARSTDLGHSWHVSRLARVPAIGGRAQVAIRPDLVAGRGFTAVVFHTLDAGAPHLTAAAAAVSTDGGRTFGTPVRIGARWPAGRVGSFYNGAGLRDRATLLADRRTVLFAYGDARDRYTAIFGVRLAVGAGS